MTARTRGLFLRALLGSAIALLVVAGSGTAALAADPEASVSVGRLVLSPTARGYQGSMSVSVTNTGSEAAYFDITVVEPVASSFEELVPASACIFTGYVDNHRISDCGVPGPSIEPGEKRTFAISFQVLTLPRSYPMIAVGGRVDVHPTGYPAVADTASFAALFRATSGALGSPRPYVQDTEAKASITAAGGATLTRQPDGSWAGRLPVTVRYAGDAGHDYLLVEVERMPADVYINGTDPQESPSFFTWFDVPYGEFMQGEQRTFDVLLAAPAETPAGDLGTATFVLSTRWGATAVPDADPTDNTLSVPVTAVANG